MTRIASRVRPNDASRDTHPGSARRRRHSSPLSRPCATIDHSLVAKDDTRVPLLLANSAPTSPPTRPAVESQPSHPPLDVRAPVPLPRRRPRQVTVVQGRESPIADHPDHRSDARVDLVRMPLDRPQRHPEVLGDRHSRQVRRRQGGPKRKRAGCSPSQQLPRGHTEHRTHRRSDVSEPNPLGRLGKIGPIGLARVIGRDPSMLLAGVRRPSHDRPEVQPTAIAVRRERPGQRIGHQTGPTGIQWNVPRHAEPLVSRKPLTGPRRREHRPALTSTPVPNPGHRPPSRTKLRRHVAPVQQVAVVRHQHRMRRPGDPLMQDLPEHQSLGPALEQPGPGHRVEREVEHGLRRSKPRANRKPACHREPPSDFRRSPTDVRRLVVSGAAGGLRWPNCSRSTTRSRS